jgi:2-dehydropantoate 2-reductase
VLLSLQNGVTNAPLLAALLQRPVLAGVAYIAAAMPAPGEVRHAGGLGLVLGVVAAAGSGTGCNTGADTGIDTGTGSDTGSDTEGGTARGARHAALQAVQQRLQQAGFEVSLSAAPLAELWRKLVVNCACNAISALAQAPYGVMASLPAVRELQAAVVREAVAVARAEGQALDEAEMLAAVTRVSQLMATQRSSTAQDLARGRTSEIEHLNGEVLRAGARHGLPTPANQALYALVKLQEAMQALAARPAV